ncbi:MAG TPA: type II toxin-antitoxin system HicA family toxin [Polyangia bacterium]
MSKLPIVSPQDCIRALSRFGYSIARQKGSHARLRAPGRNPVTVPVHKGRPLKRGTLASDPPHSRDHSRGLRIGVKAVAVSDGDLRNLDLIGEEPALFFLSFETELDGFSNVR